MQVKNRLKILRCEGRGEGAKKFYKVMQVDIPIPSVIKILKRFHKDRNIIRNYGNASGL